MRETDKGRERESESVRERESERERKEERQSNSLQPKPSSSDNRGMTLLASCYYCWMMTKTKTHICDDNGFFFSYSPTRQPKIIMTKIEE